MIYPPSWQSCHRKLHKLHCSPYVGMIGTGEKWYIGAINVPICTYDKLIRLETQLSWVVAWDLLACQWQLAWLSNQGNDRWKQWFVDLFSIPWICLNYSPKRFLPKYRRDAELALCLWKRHVICRSSGILLCPGYIKLEDNTKYSDASPALYIDFAAERLKLLLVS